MSGTAIENTQARLQSFSSYTVSPTEALELFAATRGHCPIPHSDQFGGFHILINYDDVRTAMRDWQTFSSSPSAVRPLSDRPKSPPLDYDPPEHSGWRKLFSQAFNASTAARVEGALRSDANKLIDAFASRGQCDLISDFAELLPIYAICHIIGFDPERGDQARSRVRAMLAAAADPARAAEEFAAFAEFGLGEVMKRAAAPRDDFLTALSVAEIDGRRLTPPEIGSMMISLLVAGTGTASAGLGTLMYEVLSRPALRATLQADPSLLHAAVEESLRLHPPVFGFFRRTTRRVELHDVVLERGEDVYMAWAAANRDPTVFDSPDDFRLDRNPNRHMTFGHGVHACPGAQTGRLEMRIGLSAILERLPDIRLADPSAPHAYKFGGTETAGITSLPAVFDCPRP